MSAELIHALEQIEKERVFRKKCLLKQLKWL